MTGGPGRTVDAVLFDLDDTLIDWLGSIRRCLDDIGADDLTGHLLGWAAEHTWTRRDGVVVHRNTWKLHEYADDTWAAALPDHDPTDVELTIKRFREELWVGFFPDVVATLDALVERDVRLGVLTNNHYAEREAARLRLHDWFEIVVAAPQPGIKPHPDAFAFGCAAMGTEPGRTVYVGDSVLADVEGALGAGLLAVWIDRHDDGWMPPPGVLRIRSLAELPALLAGLGG